MTLIWLPSMFLLFLSVLCPDLNKPISGSFTLSTDNETTSARFQCDVGFSMSGSAFLGCLSTGIWNDSAPTCGMRSIYCHFIVSTFVLVGF